jgi:hypothetical protein
MENNYFMNLFKVNVNDKVEKKNGLSYVSWCYAWSEVKKQFPDATYTIYENKDGWNYHTDGKTCWVKTGVTVNGIEHIEMLPVMNFRNQSIPLNEVTSFDVNKAIQRSLTKACARHGLGLYIYAGEDLPEGEEAPRPEDEVPETATPVPAFSAKETIKKFCERHSITMKQYTDYRNALVAVNAVEDIPAAELTSEQCFALNEKIYQEFVKQ